MLSTAGLGAGHGGFILHVQEMMICSHMVRARLPHMGKVKLGIHKYWFVYWKQVQLPL